MQIFVRWIGSLWNDGCYFQHGQIILNHGRMNCGFFLIMSLILYLLHLYMFCFTILLAKVLIAAISTCFVIMMADTLIASLQM